MVCLGNRIKIAVFGASGRMGRNIIRLIEASNEFKLSNIIAKDEYKGNTHKEFSSYKYSSLEDISDADILIDFSSDQGLNECLEAAKKYNVALVSGSTGLSEDTKIKLQEYSRYIPILHSNNTSMGITILKKLVANAAKLLGEDFDIEISEAHHRYKKDVPSGTALSLAQAISESMGLSLEDKKYFYREGANEMRPKDKIGFSVIRGGGIIGDHAVNFVSDEELICFSHRALDRSLFAKGALKAAKWLYKKTEGLYSMEDVIKS